MPQKGRRLSWPEQGSPALQSYSSLSNKNKATVRMKISLSIFVWWLWQGGEVGRQTDGEIRNPKLWTKAWHCLLWCFIWMLQAVRSTKAIKTLGGVLKPCSSQFKIIMIRNKCQEYENQIWLEQGHFWDFRLDPFVMSVDISFVYLANANMAERLAATGHCGRCSMYTC